MRDFRVSETTRVADWLPKYDSKWVPAQSVTIDPMVKWVYQPASTTPVINDCSGIGYINFTPYTVDDIDTLIKSFGNIKKESKEKPSKPAAHEEWSGEELVAFLDSLGEENEKEKR